MPIWRAEHRGPNGMAGAATFGSWSDAADWLAAMLRVIQPEAGFREACGALAKAVPAAPFAIVASRHRFAIVDAQAAPAGAPQPDLFIAAPPRP